MEAESYGKLSTVRLKEHFDRLAPTWDGSLGQETLTRADRILVELAIKPGSHVLDVGSGTGILLPFLSKAVGGQGRITEMDISAGMLAEARAKGSGTNNYYIQADITAIPLPEEVFDLVICFNAFPHFDDKPGALREMTRVLKSGGRLAIGHSMSREELNDMHRSIGGVVGGDRLPDNAEVYRLLEQAGLGRVKIENSPERYLAVACRT